MALVRHYNNCHSTICTFICKTKMKILGVEVGNNNHFWGVPYFDIRNNGEISIGNNNRFRSKELSNPMGLHHRCMFTVSSPIKGVVARLSIGNGCGFSGTSIWCFSKIEIGNNVRIGANTLIMDGDAHYEDKRTKPPKPIVIEDNVFIGANCVIKKGVRIGQNSVIGMNSVVTHNIPDNSVAVGIPAKVINCI